jgi:hypothetical protein
MNGLQKAAFFQRDGRRKRAEMIHKIADKKTVACYYEKMSEPSDDGQRFILWDFSDGIPRIDEETGEITSDGIIGRVPRTNVYIKTYAEYDKGAKFDFNGLLELEVGEYVWALFSLSGSKKRYQIFRVR